MKRFSILLILIAFLVVSCAGVRRTYEGPELTKEKVATIRCSRQVYIKKIDRQKTGLASEVEVLPGPSTVSAVYRSPFYVSHFYNTLNVEISCDLTFNAEAGHNYLIKLILITKRGREYSLPSRSFLVASGILWFTVVDTYSGQEIVRQRSWN